MDLSVSDTETDDYVADATDDEWVASEKIHVRKRKSRSRHVSMENNQSNIIYIPLNYREFLNLGYVFLVSEIKKMFF